MEDKSVPVYCNNCGYYGGLDIARIGPFGDIVCDNCGGEIFPVNPNVNLENYRKEVKDNRISLRRPEEIIMNFETGR